MEDYSRRRPSRPCPNWECGAIQFQFHQQVERSIHIRVDVILYRCQFRISRWKCVSCGTTFRHYPPGLLSHKRYLLDEVKMACSSFVEREKVTYASAARTGDICWVHEGAVASPEGSEEQKEREAVGRVSGATVFRWMNSLAGMLPFMRERIDGEVSLGLARWEPSVKKARSDGRRGILKEAYLALQGLACGNSTGMGMGRAPP